MAEICSTFELIGGISARLHPTCWAIGKLSVMRKPCVMTTRRDLASTLISSLPRVARSSVPGTELENFCELRERQNKTWWFVSCSQNLSKWDYFLVIDVHAQTQCANNLHEISFTLCIISEFVVRKQQLKVGLNRIKGIMWELWLAWCKHSLYHLVPTWLSLGCNLEVAISVRFI